jgi:hypothetical protein
MNHKTVVGSLLCVLFIVLASAVGTFKAHAQPTFTKAELFAGNPNYDEPKDRAKEGQGLLDNPPLAWRSLLFVGDKLVTTVGQEIWYADLAAQKPVLKRLAGKEDLKGQSLQPGPAAQARFANIFGIALLPDGSLVGADQTANTIFQIKDPFGPAATVELLAGTTQPQESVSPGRPSNVGDVDGPGAKARFALPQWPAVVGNDIYFIDEGNAKLKKVAGDAAHTVTTVTKLPEGVYYAMITLNDKLYTLANNTISEGFILEIEPTTGTIREVVRGRSSTFESRGSINVSGLATDGKGLFTTQSGQLLYVTLDGKIKSLAGTGEYFDYRGAYDPLKPQKADEVQLITTRRTMTAGSNVFLAYKDNAIYMSAQNKTPYIERLSAQ